MNEDRVGRRALMGWLGGGLGAAGALGASSDSVAQSSAGDAQLQLPDVGSPPRRLSDRLSDTVSAKDFGARGDDRTDDWPALDRALAHLARLPEGGTLYFPAGRYRIGRQLRIPNKCALLGAGCPATTLIATDGFRAPSLITNLQQDGKQEWCSLEKLNIEGNKGGGAQCAVAVVDIVSVFVNSFIRDVVISEGSNTGLRIGANAAAGPLLFENIWLARNNGDGLLVENRGVGAVNGLLFINLTSENQGTGKAAIRLLDATGNGGALGWHFINTHIEMGLSGSGSRAIVVDGASMILFDGVQLLCGDPSGLVGIEITDRHTNNNIQLRGITNANLFDPVILDHKHGVQRGAGHVSWYATPDVGLHPSRSYIAAYAKTVTPDLAQGDHLTVNVTEGRPMVIALPVNATDEMTLSVEIVNMSGGAMGVVSWQFAGGGAGWWRNPAPGKRRTLQFRRRRGEWVLIGAPSPDF